MKRSFHVAKNVLREPGAREPRSYARRVTYLAIVHPALFAICAAGFALLIWRGELFVTLTQRSNVETLTIAFFLLFFAYFATITAPGALNGVRVGWLRLRRRFTTNHAALDQHVERLLGERGDGTSVALDRIVELAGSPGQPWELDVRDDTGSFCRLVFVGVRIQQRETFQGGVNSLFGFVEHKLRELTGVRVAIVQWSSVDEDALAQYDALSTAMRATWPTLALTEAQRIELEQALGQLCPALRDEVMLPDWEFEGEHKLPIIPEPLGIISLRRTERRVDPLASLTAALGVVIVVVGLLWYFLVRPPWVPGR